MTEQYQIAEYNQTAAALAAGTITSPEAIDQAYQLGFQAGLLGK